MFLNVIIDMLINTTQEYSSITFEDQIEEVPSDTLDSSSNLVFENKIDGNYYPTYMLDGYYVEETVKIGGNTHIIFVNEEDDNIFFHQKELDTISYIDTEGALITHPEVKGEEAIMAEEDGRIILVWHNNRYSFSVIGEISVEEALKIANSIKKE